MGDAEKAIDEISVLTGYSVEELKSKSRVKGLVDGRAMIADRLVNKLGYSPTQVGDIMGAHVTSIIHLLKRGFVAKGKKYLLSPDYGLEKMKVRLFDEV